MNISIIGSRSFNDYALLKETIDKEFENKEISLIVSGGAKGADSLGEKYAINNGIAVKIFLPDWKKYGRGAGFVRNKTIVENSDVVVAFWNGVSKGTKNSIDVAKKLNKKLIIKNF